MKISDLVIYRTKTPPPGLPAPTLLNQLREVDDELQRIKNNRKEMRAKWSRLMERRYQIINNMPESERPKVGRPKKK